MNRVPLPVVQETPEPVECTECGKCCTYVGVEIETPKGAKDASDILWYLYHPGVYLYVDGTTTGPCTSSPAATTWATTSSVASTSSGPTSAAGSTVGPAK